MPPPPPSIPHLPTIHPRAAWKLTTHEIYTSYETHARLSQPLEASSAGAGPEAAALVAAVRDATQQAEQVAKLRAHFHRDVLRQLYGDADDRAFFDRIKTQLREAEARLEDGRAALAHLESAVVNVACDDPGAAIGSQLVLPLLQDRLDGRALQYAAARAAEAEEAVIRMEVRAGDLGVGWGSSVVVGEERGRPGSCCCRRGAGALVVCGEGLLRVCLLSTAKAAS